MGSKRSNFTFGSNLCKMAYLWQFSAILLLLFTVNVCFAMNNQEDFQLLEDTFAQAYDDERPTYSETKRNTIVPQPARIPVRRFYRPARPAVLAPKMYPRINRPNYMQTPRRNMLFGRPSVLFPQKKVIMYAPVRNIASFARRNPLNTQQPKYLPAPRRHAVLSPRVLSAYRPRPSYMYNPRFYNNFYRRTPFYYAQGRNFMYPQRVSYRSAPKAYSFYRPFALRSRMPTYVNRYIPPVYAYRRHQQQQQQQQQQPYGNSGDHSLAGNHLNLNMGTSSHTVSNSILKAPGHTTTDTHVINKQQTSGRVRGVAPIAKGKKQMPVSNLKYPFIGKGYGTRGRVSASAKVNAKASASTSSSSSSQSSSSSSNNGGSRTTSSSGGWGGGAGAGWGSGPNAWGIGYGGGGGGSNWKIPSNMVGIPGMPGKFPGIPNGFPGMPPGGYPSKGYANAKQSAKPNRPSSLKGQKVSLKPKKGLDQKAFKTASKSKNVKAKAPVRYGKQNTKTFGKPSLKTMQRANLVKPSKIMRVQFFSNDPMHRPVSPEWQKLRQRIISDVIKG